MGVGTEVRMGNILKKEKRQGLGQTPSIGLRHPTFGERCRKAMLGVWVWGDVWEVVAGGKMMGAGGGGEPGGPK